MRFPAPLQRAKFVERPNRFLGVVQLKGRRAQCFIPNPGRMRELLYPGAEGYVLERRTEKRKTRYNLVLVDLGGTLVSIDSLMANRVVGEAIEAGSIPEFRDLRVEKREYAYGESRLDFILRGETGQLLLEVKSCTLVRDGVGLFPDAPTARGRRHLMTLIDGLKRGRAAAFFLIQRDDAELLKPNEETDPDFASSLREARRKGVEVYAYTSEVTLDGVSIKERVPVVL